MEKYSHQPLAGVKLIVDGPSGHLESVTAKSGAHEFRALAPGHYRVRADIPEHLAYFWKAQVDVYDRGCAEVEFSARFNGQIRGTVSGLRDHALEAAKIDLIPVSGAKVPLPKGTSTFTYLGRFELRDLPPGRYLLGINISGPPNPQCPMPRLYYPGVTERSKATIIRLGESQEFFAGDFVLPSRPEQAIEGAVVWPDGLPAAGARVRAEGADCPWLVSAGYVWTDLQGRFSTKACVGARYWVHASVDGGGNVNGRWVSNWVHAEPPLVTANRDLAPLKLVLTSRGPACLRYRDPARISE